jgi:hypothetical protein
VPAPTLARPRHPTDGYRPEELDAAIADAPLAGPVDPATLESPTVGPPSFPAPDPQTQTVDTTLDDDLPPPPRTTYVIDDDDLRYAVEPDMPFDGGHIPVDAPPETEAEAVPEPWSKPDSTDMAALMRELSSLNSTAEDVPARGAGAGPRLTAPAPEKKKKRGFFGK